MKLNRFTRIPTALYPNKLTVFESTINNEVGERIVDESYYVPNKEAVKIANKQHAESILNSLVYDSPADIKSGSVNVYARQRGRDLAELTQQQRHLEKVAMDSINQQIADKKKQQAKKQQAQQAQQAQQSNVVNPASTPTSTGD